MAESEFEAARRRRDEIKRRISSAMDEADERLRGRIDWAKDTPEVQTAETFLNNAIAAYITGACTLEDVQERFKQYIHSLKIQYGVSQPEEPELFT